MTLTDQANRRLINASIYLSAYPLDVYHLPGRLNLVPDALSRLPAMGDSKTWKLDQEPVLDDIWQADHVLYAAEARIDDKMR